MTRTSVEERVQVVCPRYGKASRSQKSQILDEFVPVIGFHRKAAIRRLRGGRRRSRKRKRWPPVYTREVVAARRLAAPWGHLLEALGAVSPGGGCSAYAAKGRSRFPLKSAGV